MTLPIHKLIWTGLCLGGGLLILGYAPAAWALDHPETKAVQAIEDYIIARYPDFAALDIKIAFKQADQALARLKSAPPDAQLKIIETYEGFNPLGNAIFPIEVSAGGDKFRIFLRARVELLDKVIVAAKQIKRGALITDTDVILAERDIAMIPKKYFVDPGQVVNQEAKTSIPKNSTFFEWMVKAVPAVRRGDQVAVIVKGDNVSVKTKGVLLEDGYLGQPVKLKCGSEPKTIDGVLVATSEVEVQL